jgi:hypothetical protein
MNTLVHKPTALEVPTGERPGNGRHLILLRTEDGWSLVGPNGELAFRGFGTGGRRQCLEFARERGVLWVLS